MISCFLVLADNSGENLFLVDCLSATELSLLDKLLRKFSLVCYAF